MRAAAALAAIVLAGCASSPETSSSAAFGFEDESPVAVDHDPWDDFLATYVVIGEDGIARVAYDAVAEPDRRALDFYVARQRRVRVDALNRAEQFAFWANLHNALVVKLTLDEWPVARFSDLRIGGAPGDPRDTGVALQGGRLFSLNDIRERIMGAGLGDPRMHYALADGSLGGPSLRASAFLGEGLDAQLTQAARDYVNHPRGAKILPTGEVAVSALFFRHLDDFGGEAQAVRRAVARYAEPELAAALRGDGRLRRLPWDPSLNALTPKSAGEPGA